jgi:hypothetical protein
VVEIDPEIVTFGRRFHPERPYSDPRVAVHVDDARHFFHHAQPGYDVIVFALLDSHRLLSTLSSLRLDSYVYTVEAFRESRRLLKPDGIQVTAFAVGLDWERTRFYEMLRLAYGHEPAVWGSVYVSSPEPGALGLPVKSRPVDVSAVLATDDWPFIYARHRTIPADYLLALATILLVSTALLLRTTRGGAGRRFEGHFFWLGAGFLLLETKNVTTLALVFGSTWYVNSVVFFTVLVMALLSTLLTGWTKRLPVGWAYAGLFAALVLNSVLPLRDYTGARRAVRLVLVGGVTALPVFFSGIIFAHSFARAADPARALGSNVLGGVVGGVVEYLSLVFGLRFLFVLIGLAYALSLLALARRQKADPTPSLTFATEPGGLCGAGPG